MHENVQLARVVVELQAPLAIGAGTADDVLDAPVVLDADGLPALPGSSIGGVLRSLCALENRDAWFGSARGDQGDPSRVWVGWGRPHGADDRPVAPVLLGGLHGDDEVLDALKRTVVRDRVRLDDHGTVDDHGKFDSSFVPAGVRFTLELRVDGLDGPDIAGLVDHLDQASLGGSTRSGFGRLRVVRAAHQAFDLGTEAGRKAFAAVPRALWADATLEHTWKRTDERTSVARRRYHLALKPEQGLLIGGGAAAGGADLTWFRERRIVWGRTGRLVERPVLPGTALKGALRHRARFHLHVLCDDDSVVDRAHTWLFGTDPNRDPDADLEPGRVRTSEVLLPEGADHRQMHVALDRFTMGPRDGMLFEEEALWIEGKTLDVQVDVEVAPRAHELPEDQEESKTLGLQALERALDDLCEGRLGLGHGNSRGHGFFIGTRRTA